MVLKLPKAKGLTDAFYINYHLPCFTGFLPLSLVIYGNRTGKLPASSFELLIVWDEMLSLYKLPDSCQLGRNERSINVRQQLLEALVKGQ